LKGSRPGPRLQSPLSESPTKSTAHRLCSKSCLRIIFTTYLGAMPMVRRGTLRRRIMWINMTVICGLRNRGTDNFFSNRTQVILVAQLTKQQRFTHRTQDGSLNRGRRKTRNFLGVLNVMKDEHECDSKSEMRYSRFQSVSSVTIGRMRLVCVAGQTKFREVELNLHGGRSPGGECRCDIPANVAT
jgi:hypothetical protein